MRGSKRVRTDSPNGQTWTRLIPGQMDPSTGTTYQGPRHFPLEPGDRIVVDEAGMVDLHTANALADIARETGAGIAMVGDHLQALPVGHSGAMSLMRTRSGTVVELTAVHRFLTTSPDGNTVKDTAWADLSLRIREPGQDAAAVAQEVIDTGHAVLVATDAAAHEHMVNEWLSGHRSGQRVALVTATHSEAMTISETIQARRIEAGQLDTTRAISMQNGQAGYVGDIVQTRRNDTDEDVENRQLWRIGRIRHGVVRLVSVEDPGVVRDVSTGYLTDHAHLAYASTVHGVQGETTHRSLVGPGVDAAGLYVGLTRGRFHNAAVLVADSTTAARTALVETMRRGQIEASIDDARAAARADLAHVARRPDLPTHSDEGRPAPWHDHAARPLGRVIQLDDLLTRAVEAEKSLHEQSARLNDTIAKDQAALDEVNVKIATWAARDHAQRLSGDTPTPAPLLLPVRDALTTRLQKARAKRAELSRAYREATRQITDATREKSIRDQLGPDVNAYEADARRRAVRDRYANEVPAWDDRKRRPLGRVITLLAKRVAVKTELTQLAAERDERAARIAAVHDRLRADAGPDGVPLSSEQRARIDGLLAQATTAYDKVVERHAQLTRLLHSIDREQQHRDDLAAASETRAPASPNSARSSSSLPTGAARK